MTLNQVRLTVSVLLDLRDWDGVDPALAIKTRAHDSPCDEAEMLKSPWLGGVEKQNSTE